MSGYELVEDIDVEKVIKQRKMDILIKQLAAQK